MLNTYISIANRLVKMHIKRPKLKHIATNQNFKFFVTIVIFIITIFNLTAQNDISVELERIRHNFLSLNNVMIKMDYNLYSGKTSGELLESSPATVYKNKDYQVLEFMGNQSWYLKDKTIIISPNEKRVILGDPVSLNTATISSIQLDTLLTVFQATKVDLSNRYFFHINIPNKYNSPYSSMDIYPGKNGLYEKLILYSKLPLDYYGICSECKDKYPRLEIEFNYTENGFNMPDKKNILSTIVKQENNYSLTGKYSNYQLVNVKYKN